MVTRDEHIRVRRRADARIHTSSTSRTGIEEVTGGTETPSPAPVSARSKARISSGGAPIFSERPLGFFHDERADQQLMLRCGDDLQQEAMAEALAQEGTHENVRVRKDPHEISSRIRSSLV